MSWASLDGERIQSGNITIPYYGCAVAEVLLASSADVAAQTTLTVGNLEMVMHVVRQASFAGSRSFRLVAGYGGWRKTVGRRWYASPASLPLSGVLGDLATEVGEKVSVPSSRLISSQYARAEQQASRVLDTLAPDWWVAPDGTTTIGPRASGLIETDKTVVSYSGSKGQFQIATEDMADWMPGRTFVSQTITEPVTIGSVTISMTNDGKVRLDVLNASSTNVDRLNDPLDEIIASVAPQLAYSIPWQCTIVAVHGTPYLGPWTVDVVPTSPRCPLPGMTTVQVAPSIQGCSIDPSTGGTCVVVFLNGDPQLPRVVWFDSADPDAILMGGTTTDPVVTAAPVGRVLRYGDTIAVPGVGDLIIAPGSVPMGVSKVRA